MHLFLEYAKARGGYRDDLVGQTVSRDKLLVALTWLPSRSMSSSLVSSMRLASCHVRKRKGPWEGTPAEAVRIQGRLAASGSQLE
jgi:hypothetical protein